MPPPVLANAEYNFTERVENAALGKFEFNLPILSVLDEPLDVITLQHCADIIPKSAPASDDGRVACASDAVVTTKVSKYRPGRTDSTTSPSRTI